MNDELHLIEKIDASIAQSSAIVHLVRAAADDCGDSQSMDGKILAAALWAVNDLLDQASAANREIDEFRMKRLPRAA